MIYAHKMHPTTNPRTPPSLAPPPRTPPHIIIPPLPSTQPTFFLGVPRVWEKIQAKMIATKQAAIASGEMSPLKVSVSEWGKQVSLDHAHACQMGGNASKDLL